MARAVVFAAVLLAAAVALASASPKASALRMPVVFSSNMVLQRAPQSARVWGWANAGVTVTVSIAGQTHTATAGSDGSWLATLNPVGVSSTEYTLAVTDSQGGSVSLSNVLFGDVFLCSGQSNMQFTVSMVNNASAEIADSIHYPLMRVFSVAQKASLTPLYDVKSKAPYQWGVSSPAVIGGPDWQYFSASCYFFGRTLYQQLAGSIPIGLVDSDWGGTYVQAWSSPDALSKCNSSDAIDAAVKAYGLEAFDAAALNFDADAWADKDAVKPLDDPTPFTLTPAAAEADADPSPNTPSVLWNGMIVPLLHMRFAGAAWYQGEANSGAPVPYACQFPAMISDWRLKFGLQLPFYFVQLAPFLGDTSFPALRWAQTAALALPNTGMAVAMDLGDPGSPEGSIHPRDKQTVGLRLALNALALQYSVSVPYAGPSVASWGSYESDGVTTFTVAFASNAGDSKLSMRGTENCELCCIDSPWMWLNNQTQQWIPIAPESVTFSGLTATVTVATNGADCAAVNYAWQTYPQCVLYNSARLPAPEFALSNQ